MAAQAKGRYCWRRGNVTAALPVLRTAASAWRAAHMPYEVARTAVLLGLACAALGDRVGAGVEFDSATSIFCELGPRPTWPGASCWRPDWPTTEVDANRRSYPPVNSRYWSTWRQAEPIGRLPSVYSSARTPSPATSNTSTRSSASPTGPRRPPMPTSTIWCDHGSSGLFASRWGVQPMPDRLATSYCSAMSSVSYRHFTGTAAENYQRDFVPLIATPVSKDLLRIADLQPGNASSMSPAVRATSPGLPPSESATTAR